MNGKNFTETNRDFITLDEQGKVVVQDDRLAKASEQLTLEELEKISGGINVNRCNPGVTVNIGCCPG